MQAFGIFFGYLDGFNSFMSKSCLQHFNSMSQGSGDKFVFGISGEMKGSIDAGICANEQWWMIVFCVKCSQTQNNNNMNSKRIEMHKITYYDLL